MKTQIITKNIIVNRIKKILLKLKNSNYKLTKSDFIILEISFLRLRNYLYIKKNRENMNGNELFWDIVINFEPLLTKDEFVTIIKAKRKKDLILTDFLKNQIHIFKKLY